MSFQTQWRLHWPRYSRFFTRRILARWLSTFLTATMVVIPSFKRLGGPSAFLALTVLALVFGVQGTVAQQVEATVLNVACALIAIATATLGRYISSLCPDNSTRARTVPAIFLIFIVFIAGLVKSTLPRLQLGARISCLITVFMLTTSPGIAADAVGPCANYVWILLCPAVISLFGAFLFLPWFTSQFAQEVAGTFGKLRGCLSAKLDEASAPTSQPLPVHKYRQMLPDLFRRSVQLNTSYFQASFELRVGRLSVKSLKPLIGVVEYLRRDLSWGKFESEVVKNGLPKPVIHPAVMELGIALVASMETVGDIVRATYEYHFRSPILSQEEKRNMISQVRHKLLKARENAIEELNSSLGAVDEDLSRPNVDDERTIAGGIPTHLRQYSEFCLFTTSLLQMAQEMRQALLVADNLITQYDQSRTRLWLPRLTWAWLGMSPPTVYLGQQHPPSRDPVIAHEEPGQSLTSLEAQQGILEHQAFFNGGGASVSRVSSHTPKPPMKISWNPIPFIFHVWASAPVLRVRIAISKAYRAFMTSAHLQLAFKHAAGVALLSLPAWLPVGSSGQRWFVETHGQWMVISYCWVLDINSGATWRTGYLRITGTVLGAVYAYITYLICHTNPYGLVAMVTFSDVPISWIVCLTSTPPIGLVAAIAIPPIVFAKYEDPALTTPIVMVAVYRGAMIAIGIVAALIVNTVLWPRHCRVMFLSQTSHSLGLLSQLYLMLGRELFQRTQSVVQGDVQKILKMELHIRNSLARLGQLVVTMDDELCLAPKPMGIYRRTVVILQTVLDTMSGLHTVREYIPPREAVTAVLRERREFVSGICLALYASEHAFRARQPLPHFLPPLQGALSTLVLQLEESSGYARPERREESGLPLAYTCAETKILGGMADTMESLLDVCRTLFGTATWLEPEAEEPRWSEVNSLKDVEEDEKDLHELYP
ncbi:hypothetical protein OF83DRAFT_100961 [Amylostereum chailletii]|nr:hypothetical protein OF83DRAFT_100961 [Amylostereum chailletii]